METGNDHTMIPKNCLQYGISISVAPQNLSSGSMKMRMTAPATVPKIRQNMPIAVKSPAASFVLPSPILDEQSEAHPPSMEARAPWIMNIGEHTLNDARAVGPRYLEMNRQKREHHLGENSRGTKPGKTCQSIVSANRFLFVDFHTNIPMLVDCAQKMLSVFVRIVKKMRPHRKWMTPKSSGRNVPAAASCPVSE